MAIKCLPVWIFFNLNILVFSANPRLVKTLIGADINELLNEETKAGENRLISGSVLSGRHAVQAHRIDAFVIGRPLGAVIETAVMVVAVIVVLAIRLVVFLVVGNEVVDGEAVMGGDEIDGGPGRRPRRS